MMGFVEDREFERGELDRLSIEKAMFPDPVVKPCPDERADAARTGAADDDLKLESHDESDPG